MSGSPHGALDIAREVEQAAVAFLPRLDGRLVCARLQRIREFRRIGYKTGNYGRNRILHRRHGYAILRAGNPTGTTSPAFRIPTRRRGRSRTAAGTNGNAYLARIDRQHDILSGFAVLPAKDHRIGVDLLDSIDECDRSTLACRLRGPSQHRPSHFAELILDGIQPRAVGWGKHENEALRRALQVAPRLLGGCREWLSNTKRIFRCSG
jgi:hypothetical protein